MVAAGNERPTPRVAVASLVERRGATAVVEGCVGLLTGVPGAVSDDDLIRTLSTNAADHVLAGGEGGRDGHWPRVWAARALLYVWDDAALPAVRKATQDEAWRVREMAAKVTARQELGDLLDEMTVLRQDPVPRVAAAAERALVALTAAGA